MHSKSKDDPQLDFGGHILLWIGWLVLAFWLSLAARLITRNMSDTWQFHAQVSALTASAASYIMFVFAIWGVPKGTLYITRNIFSNVAVAALLWTGIIFFQG